MSYIVHRPCPEHPFSHSLNESGSITPITTSSSAVQWLRIRIGFRPLAFLLFLRETALDSRSLEPSRSLCDLIRVDGSYSRKHNQKNWQSRQGIEEEHCLGRTSPSRCPRFPLASCYRSLFFLRVCFVLLQRTFRFVEE